MDVLTIGSRVWVKDPEEAWVKAEVLKVEGTNAVVQLEDIKQQRSIVASECFLQNPGNRGVEVRGLHCILLWLLLFEMWSMPVPRGA